MGVLQSKMLLKQSDPTVLDKKVNIKPNNYAELNRLSEDFGKRFVPQQELSDEQAFRLQTSHPNTDQSASSPVKTKAPRELPKITPDALTEGEWGFEHTKAVFIKEIIPFVKTLKDIFNVFDKDILNEEKVFVITTLKNDLRKFKGKDVVKNAAQVSNATTIAPGIYKLDPPSKTWLPKDKNNRETHIYYLKHTMEQAAILRKIVEQAKSLNPLNSASYSTCKYVKLIQELLGYVRDTCPDIYKPSEKLIAVTPVNKKKTVRTTKNDRILQISSSTQKKNKVEDHSRIVKSCLNKPNYVVEPSGNANVQHSKLNTNSELMCVKCNSSMFDARHELCFLEFVSDMNASSKSKSVKKAKKKEEWKPTRKVFTKIGYNWRPTGRTFTLVGNACPLTRITATNKVPLREPIPLEVVAQESVVTKVYTRRPKVVQIVLWYLDSGCSKHMTEDRSQLTNFVHKFLGTVKFGNDQIAKIMGYGEYQIGNIIILRVYYVKGLGYNLLFVGQFCISDLEVPFRKHTCFVCNLEGVDLLLGSRETNLYTLSIGDMMLSSNYVLLSKASKTKSWLWHRRLSHLNFGAINHLAKNGLT
ncbi:integrase, catalytic region, zinc finger, CCHC-type containing protein [Tanacetum coccineum]